MDACGKPRRLPCSVLVIVRGPRMCKSYSVLVIGHRGLLAYDHAYRCAKHEHDRCAIGVNTPPLSDGRGNFS
jgi:hypothetical protein